MPAALSHPRPDVRTGQRLNDEQLRAGAEKAWRDSGMTQRQIAADLSLDGQGDVTHSAVSRAANEAGPQFAKLQVRMIARYLGYEVEAEERVTFYRVTGKT